MIGCPRESNSEVLRKRGAGCYRCRVRVTRLGCADFLASSGKISVCNARRVHGRVRFQPSGSLGRRRPSHRGSGRLISRVWYAAIGMGARTGALCLVSWAMCYVGNGLGLRWQNLRASGSFSRNHPLGANHSTAATNPVKSSCKLELLSGTIPIASLTPQSRLASCLAAQRCQRLVLG